MKKWVIAISFIVLFCIITALMVIYSEDLNCFHNTSKDEGSVSEGAYNETTAVDLHPVVDDSDKNYEAMEKLESIREVNLLESEESEPHTVSEFIANNYDSTPDSLTYFDTGYVDGEFNVYMATFGDSYRLFKIKDGVVNEIDDNWNVIR